MCAACPLLTASSLEPLAAAFCAAHGHSLLGPVGAGAFKETFHIVLSEGGSRALKVYKPGFSADRTEREIAAMQKCSHANIGRLAAITTFSHGGSQFLLSLEEFLPGGTLSARLSKGPLTIDEARSMGLQLVDAVAHIASHELVHRDLKPDNILFRADGATGNAHVRRVIVEASWCYQHRPWLGGYLAKRQKGMDPALVEIAWKAQHRLHKRYQDLTRKGKNKPQTVVAVGGSYSDSYSLSPHKWSASTYSAHTRPDDLSLLNRRWKRHPKRRILIRSMQ